MNICSNNDDPRRNIFCHNRVRSNDRLITDLYRPENFRPGPEINTVTDSRPSHHTVSVPNGNLMADHDVFTKDSAASNNNTKGVRNEDRLRQRHAKITVEKSRIKSPKQWNTVPGEKN